MKKLLHNSKYLDYFFNLYFFNVLFIKYVYIPSPLTSTLFNDTKAHTCFASQVDNFYCMYLGGLFDFESQLF